MVRGGSGIVQLKQHVVRQFLLYAQCPAVYVSEFVVWRISAEARSLPNHAACRIQHDIAGIHNRARLSESRWRTTQLKDGRRSLTHIKRWRVVVRQIAGGN